MDKETQMSQTRTSRRQPGKSDETVADPADVTPDQPADVTPDPAPSADVTPDGPTSPDGTDVTPDPAPTAPTRVETAVAAALAIATAIAAADADADVAATAAYHAACRGLSRNQHTAVQADALAAIGSDPALVGTITAMVAVLTAPIPAVPTAPTAEPADWQNAAAIVAAFVASDADTLALAPFASPVAIDMAAAMLNAAQVVANPKKRSKSAKSDKSGEPLTRGKVDRSGKPDDSVFSTVFSVGTTVGGSRITAPLTMTVAPGKDAVGLSFHLSDGRAYTAPSDAANAAALSAGNPAPSLNGWHAWHGPDGRTLDQCAGYKP